MVDKEDERQLLLRKTLKTIQIKGHKQMFQETNALLNHLNLIFNRQGTLVPTELMMLFLEQSWTNKGTRASSECQYCIIRSPLLFLVVAETGFGLVKDHGLTYLLK